MATPRKKKVVEEAASAVPPATEIVPVPPLSPERDMRPVTSTIGPRTYRDGQFTIIDN